MTALVIFDCDGVLIDSEIISTSVMVEQLARHGISLDAHYVLENFIGHPYALVADRIAALIGRALPETFAQGYRTALLQRFEVDLKAMPGIADVLDQLAVPYCAATSSSPERARHSLRAAGLSERFGERVYTVSMVAHPKPAPDLFLHAAAEMRAAPKDCLVVEDSDLGIAAARAAGMQAWQFAGGSHFAASHRRVPNDIKPDRLFDRMADFFAGAPHLRR